MVPPSAVVRSFQPFQSSSARPSSRLRIGHFLAQRSHMAIISSLPTTFLASLLKKQYPFFLRALASLANSLVAGSRQMTIWRPRS